MNIHYYLSVFPIEALIASELDAGAFSAYMATASHRGSSEPHSFIEVKNMESLSDSFDLKYAEDRCVASGEDRKKNSVYLSIYRTLEKIPLANLGDLYLVTRDGRSLCLQAEFLEGVPPQTKEFYIYQEMCPVRPVVVTTLGPCQFCRYVTSTETKIHVPRLIIADLRVLDLDSLNDAGNIGAFYHKNLTHLKDCILSVTAKKNKIAKTLDRARVESFTYQLVDTGFYIGDQEGIMYYRMKSVTELNMYNHAWARSAMIL